MLVLLNSINTINPSRGSQIIIQPMFEFAQFVSSNQVEAYFCSSTVICIISLPTHRPQLRTHTKYDPQDPIFDYFDISNSSLPIPYTDPERLVL